MAYFRLLAAFGQQISRPVLITKHVWEQTEVLKEVMELELLPLKSVSPWRKLQILIQQNNHKILRDTTF